MNLWFDGQLNSTNQGSTINDLNSEKAAKFLKRKKSRKLTPNGIRLLQELISSFVKNKNAATTKEKKPSDIVHQTSVRTSWELPSGVLIQKCLYILYLATVGEKNQHRIKHSRSDPLKIYISKPCVLPSARAKLLSVNAYNLSSQLTSLIHHTVCENIKATQLWQVNSRVRQ